MVQSCSSLNCGGYSCCAKVGQSRAAQAVRHGTESSEANPKHRVATVERMWDSPKLPRSSLKRTAVAVADMWDGSELLKPNLSKLLMLRTSGMAKTYPSLPSRSYTCWWAKAARVQSVKLLMLRTCPTRPAKTVADMWDCPELLKSTLSKLLVLHTWGLAPSH